ncbi:MAG: hypothetical protein WCA35_04230, partial [Kovacikia sp.]
LSRIDSDTTTDSDTNLAADSDLNPVSIAAGSQVSGMNPITTDYLQATHFKIASHRLQLVRYAATVRHKAKPHGLKGHLKLQPIRLLLSQQ